jgi:hypothetical protein
MLHSYKTIFGNLFELKNKKNLSIKKSIALATPTPTKSKRICGGRSQHRAGLVCFFFLPDFFCFFLIRQGVPKIDL